MKYAYIESLRETHRITKMCEWLSVSRSGYYKWRHREPSKREQQRAFVEAALLKVFEAFDHRYGSPRLTVELNDLGIACSQNHVAKLMSDNALRARNGKQYKYDGAWLKHNHVSDNLLRRDFTASRPNEKWVSDITYIPLEKGFVYLAVIMDLFSRKIVGWALDTQMTNRLILDALEMAIGARGVEPGLILHSDRGVQYRSSEYQYALSREGIIPSMSRKGNCWDNAAMESFFGRMKVESVHGEQFGSKSEAYRCIFDYIEVFYNRVRRHSANGYKSPVAFEEEYEATCN